MDAIGWRCLGRRFAQASALVLLAAAGSASAASVYKCRDAQGHVAYQDRACAVAQQQSQIELIEAPPPTVPEPRREAAADHVAPARKARSSRHATEREVMSWECRGADGAVFYRHSACPKSIPDTRASAGHRKGGAKPIGVSATPLPRAEVCQRLARAGSIGRGGHAHDEVVSTYDKHAGRDPCRRY